MSLRTKITIALLVVIGLFAAGHYAFLRSTMSSRFGSIEDESAKEDLARIQSALQEQLAHVESQTRGWANWDSLYQYVQSQDATFVLEHLSPARLASQNIDLLFIVGRPEGERVAQTTKGDGTVATLHGYRPVLWSRLEMPGAAAGQTLSLFPREALSPGHPLLGPLAESGRSGVLLTEYRPLLVCAQPIRRSNGDGDSGCTLVLGRFLADDLEGSLRQQTHVQFDAYQADGRHELPSEIQELLPRITSSPVPVLEHTDEQLFAYGTFDDIRNRPELILRARLQRDISHTGDTALFSGWLSTITGGVILVFVLLGLLRRIVLDPLSKLTTHAQDIGSKENFRAQIDMTRDDELGVLASEFNQMMGKLEEARAAYVQTARSAGMSQVATGILHNVGNVLSSVNVATELLNQRLLEWPVGDLEKLNQVLQSRQNDLADFIRDDPRGKHLQPFLAALTEQFIQQRKATLDEIGSLTRGVEHICELVKAQQSYTCAKDLREVTQLSKLLDEAARIAEQSMFHDPNLVVTREYQDLPEMEVDRHRILEILINLVTNARQAMDGASPREIVLRLYQREDRVFLEVQDTGKGMTPEELQKAFNAGFTTKPSGQGYGLHSSANAATEIGGKLRAHSPGRGQGATFVLEIPCTSLTPQA
ncbi:MAG: CHASE4 domain-containing protein [Planctomycetota bacterium]